jgi:hypothetical protein
MSLGAALVGSGEVAAGRRVLAETVDQATAMGQAWIAAMSELLLARALLSSDPGDSNGAGSDPGAALTVLRQSLRHFAAEDDVGNVLSCLHTGALALTRTGRVADGAVLLAAVRRHAARRGLDPEATDPAGAAALLAGLHGADEQAAARIAAELTEDGMIALLGAGQD